MRVLTNRNQSLMDALNNSLLVTVLIVVFLGDTFADEPGKPEAREFKQVPDGEFEYFRATLIEPPKQSVTLKIHAFEISVHEVTVGTFRKFVTETGFVTDSEAGRVKVLGFGLRDGKLSAIRSGTWKEPGFPQTDSHPVTCISYADATEFCSWMTDQKDGFTYRLPTAAEWQWACQGGNRSALDYPPDAPARHVNVADRALSKIDTRAPKAAFDDTYIFTAPVNAGRPGLSGLVYIHGNVSEMCSCVAEIEQQIEQTHLIICGGDWASPIEEATTKTYAPAPKSYVYTGVGFRLVRLKQKTT